MIISPRKLHYFFTTVAVMQLLHSTVNCKAYEYLPTPSIYEIDSCQRKITVPGRYRLWGNIHASKNSFIRYCSLKINSPAGSDIRITFGGSHTLHPCTPGSAISILDGWEVREPFKRKLSFLPRHLKDTGELVCPSPYNTADFHFKSSYNLAEIIYILQPDEQFIVNVQFQDTNQDCYSYISENDLHKTLKMTADLETCVWRLPGAVVMKILNVQCGSTTTAYAMVGENRDSMNPLKDLCLAMKGENIVLPCKFADIVFKSHEGSSFIQFELRMADFWETLKSSQYCS